jgi:hypothetical protein
MTHAPQFTDYNLHANFRKIQSKTPIPRASSKSLPRSTAGAPARTVEPKKAPRGHATSKCLRRLPGASPRRHGPNQTPTRTARLLPLPNTTLPLSSSPLLTPTTPFLIAAAAAYSSPQPHRSIARARFSARPPPGAPPAWLDSCRGRLLRALSHPSPL